MRLKGDGTFPRRLQAVLGGSWDSQLFRTGVITLLIFGVTPTRPFRGGVSRVISPVIKVVTISHEPPSRVQG